jgi:hypothetical protein
MIAYKKSTHVDAYYRMERKDKAGRWMPVMNLDFVNFSSTLEGLKGNITQYNNYRRHWKKTLPALPMPRRFVKVTTHTTELTTRARVK